MQSGKRWIAICVTAAALAVGFEATTPALAGATQVELVCVGRTGDNASSLGDSKATLAALAAFTGGGGLSFSVEVTPHAPEKVTPSSGPFDASFDLALTMPATIVKAAHDTLGLSKITVTNATFGVSATGAATATLSKNVPTLDVDLTVAPVVVRQTVSGRITPTSAGKIVYKPGDTTMSIGLNTVFNGITLNSLGVTCGGNKEISSTSVQVPGAPIVTPVVFVIGTSGKPTGRIVLPGDITPDDGNPIDPASLRVVAQSPAGGRAMTFGNGIVWFEAPAAQGLYFVTHEVCAAAKKVPAVPGVDATQTLTWPEPYVGRDLNAHPISMRLKFKGATSAPIPLSYLLGQPSPVDPASQTFADQFLAQFEAPSTARLRAALEQIPTIGAGNVAVTGGGTAPYSITFVGALGGAEQPKIEVVDWNTWLPASGLASLLAILNPPPPPPGTPTTTTIPKPPETVESLDAKLAAGAITVDQWLAGRGEILKASILAGATTPENIRTITGLFPKTPEVQTTVDGAAPVPEGSTGPLCSRFDVGYWIIDPPAVVAGENTTNPGPTATKVVYRTTCAVKTVTVRGRHVRRKVCTTRRVVLHRLTKTLCSTKRVKVNGTYTTRKICRKITYWG